MIVNVTKIKKIMKKAVYRLSEASNKEILTFKIRKVLAYL